MLLLQVTSVRSVGGRSPVKCTWADMWNTSVQTCRDENGNVHTAANYYIYTLYTPWISRFDGIIGAVSHPFNQIALSIQFVVQREDITYHCQFAITSLVLQCFLFSIAFKTKFHSTCNNLLWIVFFNGRQPFFITIRTEVRVAVTVFLFHVFCWLKLD